MTFDRRTFFQGCLSLGLGSLAWGRYQQAIAASSFRKLALLVGINKYKLPAAPPASFLGPLLGCVTDVELQRDLLIQRYGFHASDILSLTNAQATAIAIESAFSDHLANQAKPGDVVIIHFSGYGGRSAEGADYLLTHEAWAEGALTCGLTLARLQELVQSLATDQVTLILDTSYASTPQPWQGNLRGRSAPETVAVIATPTASPGRGTLLRAAHAEQIAVEIQGNGFHSGLFTHALTQYLWQSTPPHRLVMAMAHTADIIVPRLGDRLSPQATYSQKATLFAYASLSTNAQGAEGYIKTVQDAQIVTLSLRGLSPELLSYTVLNSQFQAGDVVLSVTEKTGLDAKATLQSKTETSALREGQAVQEWVREIPRHPELTIALGSQLERIERVDATSALAALPGSRSAHASITTVSAVGEQRADCVLDKLEGNQYVLLTEGGQSLLQLQTQDAEAIKSAIGRLVPTFDQLLALKWLRLTVNDFSSRLALRVSLSSHESTPRLLIQTETRRSPLAIPKSGQNFEPTFLPTIAPGTALQFRLENFNPLPLYYQILGINSQGTAIAWYTDPTTIPPQQEQAVPPIESLRPWDSGQNAGVAQLFIVVSCRPFSQANPLLVQEAGSSSPGRILELKQPLTLVRALLEDLQIQPSSTEGDSYSLHLQDWATIPILYQVR